MKVTKEEEQGLRLALSLARTAGKSTLSDLAEREQLSVALTAKILGKLRRGGVVRALRGRNGRYELTATAEEVTVADVLHALAPAVVRGCFNAERTDGEPCPHADDCSLRPVWQHIEHQVAGVLEQITLVDLLREEEQVNQQVERLWPARTLGRGRPSSFDPPQ
ncbi:MAG: Rrf2 family transcriptional regulator [Deltaproteobacteria bacterium]|jgi:Rrf2 family protein|nr:Rrf2 family transcriptional regulator [Deltaproteobacteria bacterium]MBW2534898.1 Rrf2 family transcriptional regulator [Deltaproteobacteria bacterium]